MMKTNFPILFDNQKEITSSRIAELQAKGLIVRDKTMHTGGRRSANVSNPTAGDVVGYSILAQKFKNGDIEQDDARDLLSIEATREGGPRETHMARLLANAYGVEKSKIIERMTQWGQKQK